MAKFNFAMPGRSKKTAVPPKSAEPISKAHKILGSTDISIDTFKDHNLSNSNIAHAGSEGKGLRGVKGGRTNVAGTDTLLKELEREWADESDILPRHTDWPVHGSDPGVSDPSALLRQQPSSSTIRSWYDRTKMPLAISQQTSASAMAKGPPNKAERVLDIDNAQALPKAKKKPAMLDLSYLKPGIRARKGSDWEEATPESEKVHRSPSILSPLSSHLGGKRERRKIQKRPTLEHLRRQAEVEPPRPATDGEAKSRQLRNEQTNDLPILYKHYEQMSFGQVLDGQNRGGMSSREDLSRGMRQENHAGPSSPYRGQKQPRRESVAADPVNNYSVPIEHSHFTQIVRAPTPTKTDQRSPDYAASVSSRHTRTSKASKRTETSFQMADLQEKSVLMLSSDSEEDEDEELYAGSPVRRPAAVSPSGRPLSTTAMSIASSFEGRRAPPMAVEEKQQQSTARQSNSTVKNLDTNPNEHLALPSNMLGKTSALLSPSNSSLGSSYWGHTFHLPATPSTLSHPSEHLTEPSRMWRESSSCELYERSIATQAAPTLNSRESQQDWNNRSYFDSRYSGTTSGRGSGAPVRSQLSQPTPPLSPSSMDFYIQSPRSSSAARTSTNDSLMGLTRQEHLLITALRQRREDMRKSGILTEDDRRQESGHQAKPSEATLRSIPLGFDFPIPPNVGNAMSSSLRASDSIASSLNLPISGAREPDYGDASSTFTTDSPVFLLSPPPPSRPKPTLAEGRLSQLSRRESGRLTPANDQMVMYLDNCGGPALTISEGVMSPDSHEEPYSSVHFSPNGSPERTDSASRQPLAIKVDQPQQIWESPSPLLPPTRALPPLPPKKKNKKPAGDEESTHMDAPSSDLDIPRPDSPISPMAHKFPEVPRERQTVRNQVARLSAFGPPCPTEPGWWGDDD